MIISSLGFRNLNVSYFDKKIKLVLMKSTDLEIIGENSFTGLIDLKTLSLNYNNITTIHELAFRDLVNVEKIEMVYNSIESLKDETFTRNINLKLVLLYNNQIKVINSKIFGKNLLLESLQLQNNAISQIEKRFYSNLTSLTRVDFSNNLCISENLQISRFVQWASHQYKFKDCSSNFELMKSTNEVIYKTQTKLDDLETQVAGVVEKVNNDMKILEGKMDNSTAMEEVRTDLINFFNKDRKNLTRQFDNDLNNITSHVKTDMMEEIARKLENVLEKKQEAKQEKLVSNDFDSFRQEFHGKFRAIYCLFFAFVCLGCLTTIFIFHKLNIFQVPLYSGYNTRDQRQLIDPEN